ncbi:lipid-binding SYLF domain-containing protein [Paraburkholderia elongata]|uniref:Twin-arginine translocation pathway signal protein n=1 Tax=Paraburkholderia elongata TaxID=2675747 RepID=A0A972NP41_9BURK|nr:lipid-binding SYLF domain-containing protein [Paraburkholderia elongata]NPT55838.1 twin-arginine translocation pathway signal protein [Paraburkholderia elongata]
MSIKSLRLTALLPLLFVAACSGMGGSSSSTSSRADLEQEARTALNTLYTTTPRAKEVAAHSVGVLVFPSILKAGLLIGGSGGNGVLFVPDGHVLGYYNATSLSYGLQAGAQSFSEAMVLMKPSALNYLNNSSDGWSIGAGPSVVVAESGMASDFSSTTARSDVYAFIFGQSGLMAGIGVQGQKISRLSP